MSYKASGKVNFIYETQIITDTFKKREVILEIAENPTYPQYVKFEFIQDKCDLLDNFQQGQVVDIEFNLNGRISKNKEGTNVCYNSLNGYTIKPNQG